MKRILIVLLFIEICAPAFSQHKSIEAFKITQPIKIDGILDETVWQAAPVATDFIQNFPSAGLPATTKTSVKILYDNTAIYIGAYLYDDPSLIKKQITSRDGEQQSDVDYFSVFIDTYDDQQNGFQFLVTSMNVQSDARLGPNLGGGFGSFGDKSWDAVWDSKVNIVSDGWIVEMKIPYISLRFAKKELQNWGLQFLRFTRRTNENSYWSAVDPNINGFLNQFGKINGLKNIQPPLRLSLSPYVSTGFRSTPQLAGWTNEWLKSGGMDIKYGLNESFTLDATLIPDFGQVVSDNTINNLTPYEVKFQENRPFFTEGTEIFNKAGLFYSRRIGATPAGYYKILDTAVQNSDIEIVKNPTVTQLYNAIKFSGRTKKKLGIGIFNAVTAPTHAIIKNMITGAETPIQTAPLSNYNIIVLDQALKGQSYITFTNTNVLRKATDRNANVSAIDLALYNKSNSYRFNGTVRYSKIWGNENYDGYNTTVRFSKISGNWRYFIQNNIESKRYDPNDLGFLLAPNEVTYKANINYGIYTATKNLITYNYALDIVHQSLYQPHAFSKVDIIGTGFWVFKNFWDVTFRTIITPSQDDYFVLQTDGKFIRYPFNYIFDVFGSTDSRKRLYFNYEGIFARAPKFDNTYYSYTLGFRYRFNNKFSLSVQEQSNWEGNQLGYAFLREANGDPIAGFRDNKEFISILSGTYNFTSRMSLTFRGRHYWNQVLYKSFYNTGSNGEIISRPFIAAQDQNVNLFNFDAFYSWDFRLGSRLVIGWKNALGNDEVVNGSRYNTYLKNFSQVFDLRHSNELTVKFIYFLDYNQLRKKS